MASKIGDLPAPFKVHPSVQVFLSPPPAFLRRHFARGGSTPSGPRRPPAPTFLATSAIVFDRPLSAGDLASAPRPRVLLVQRAPHDSMPLLWETPGGGCDDDDASILHACARELREEAGLEAAFVGPLVRCAADAAAAAGGGGPEEGEAEWGERMGGHFFFTRRGRLVAKFYFVLEPEQTSKVVVDPAEHAAYVWATEEEVRNKRMEDHGEKEGMALNFTTKTQREVLLEAFKLWKEGKEDI